MNLSSFMEFLTNLSDPPCEKYKCENFTTCSNQELACESFALYVQSGYSYPPKKSRFSYDSNKIFAINAIYRQLYREMDES